jgi:hypothetical protein
MFDPYGSGQDFVFECRKELVFNVRQRFPAWKNPNGRKVSELIDHISFWTKEWRCELYDREAVLDVPGGVAKHTYGFVPYNQIDTGLGNRASDNDLKKRYVGILRYVKDILVSESRDYSIGDIILKRNAFPWGFLTGPNAQSVTEIFQKFGEYNTLPEGVEIHDMSPKMPPEALLTWLSVASSYLASHAAPPSVRGIGESGVRSGSDRRQLIAEASVRYQYSNEAFKNGIAKVLSNCARVMKNVIPGSISVWARTPTDEFDIEIDKDKMKEPFTFYVEFAPISEEDEYRRHDDLERLFKSGLATKSWARRQMSNVDNEAMELEDEVEALKIDPLVRQIISQYVAGRLSQALEKKMAADNINNPAPQPPQDALSAQAGGLSGQMNSGGQPMTPGRRMVAPSQEIVAPGSAGDLQRKMAQARSQTPMNPTQGMGGGGFRK